MRSNNPRTRGCPLRPIADIPISVLQVQPVEFKPGSAKLASRKGSSEPYPTVIELSKELGRFEDHCVLIVGHADANSDSPPFDVLSRRRAEVVRRYLLEHSAPADRLGVSQHADECTVQMMGAASDNRRVTFTVFRCPLPNPKVLDIDCDKDGWFLLQPLPEPSR